MYIYTWRMYWLFCGIYFNHCSRFAISNISIACCYWFGTLFQHSRIQSLKWEFYNRFSTWKPHLNIYYENGIELCRLNYFSFFLLYIEPAIVCWIIYSSTDYFKIYTRVLKTHSVPPSDDLLDTLNLGGLTYTLPIFENVGEYQLCF